MKVLSALPALYFAALLLAGRGITMEYWDGFLALMNSLRLAGEGGDRFYLTLTRPPVGWVLLSPICRLAWHSGGGFEVLQVLHRIMPVFAAALLWACGRLYRTALPPAAAAAAIVLLAFNPLLVRYAPFVLFDVFSALALIPFLLACGRWLERQDARSFLLLLAAYALAVLSRYQLSVFAVVPLVCHYSRPKARLLSPVWLLPPLAYPLCIMFMTLVLGFASSDGWRDCARQANADFVTVFFSNMVAKRGDSPWYAYPRSLWLQLGPAWFLLMILGLRSFFKEKAQAGRVFAVALTVPLLILSVGVGTKEDRYLIAFLPLVYAAVVKGALGLLPEKAVPRAAAAAFLAVLAPWGQCAASWRFLATEASIRSPVPAELASLFDAETRRGGCVGWNSDPIYFHSGLDFIDRDIQIPALDSLTMSFFTQRRVVDDAHPRAGDCRPTLAVKPVKSGGGGSELLARIGARGEVYSGGVRGVSP